MLSLVLRRRLAAPLFRASRRPLSTYGSTGGGSGLPPRMNESWMTAYPWVNLTAGFFVGYAGTVFLERSFLKPKQAALHD